MSKAKVDFIGIGAEKAASYWIEAVLREHPEACFSTRKELAFFNEFDQHYLTVKNIRYQRGLSWYLKHFSHCKENNLKGEYTPTYLYSRKTAQRIKKHFPKAKLIVCLRNPVNRAFSQYLHDKSIGIINNISFERAIKKYTSYIEKGYYYKHLKNYLAYFPKKNILILFTKDIKKSPKAQVKKLYKFLQLKKTSFVPKSLLSRPNSASISKFPYINRVLIQIEYFLLRNNLNFLHQFLEDTNMRKLSFNLTYFKNRKTIRRYPKMNDATRKKLTQLYLDDIKKLEKLLNVDLKSWKKL